jgi:hypothetical protein
VVEGYKDKAYTLCLGRISQYAVPSRRGLIPSLSSVCPGDKLQYGLLRKHWLAYSLLALMCLTNLELLTLFPWDYAQFPLAAHLDGYPSPMYARQPHAKIYVCIFDRYIEDR